MKPLKIFVVDDDLFYLHLFKQHLFNLGFEDVHLFENGVDCLIHLFRKPDIIFLDYDMEKYSGQEVLKKIKQHNPNVMVVVISAQQDAGTAHDLLKHGAFEYLQKGNNEFSKIAPLLKGLTENQKPRNNNSTFLI